MAALASVVVFLWYPRLIERKAVPVDILRARLAGDIAVMGRLEPLIQSGLVAVTALAIAMCTNYARQFKAQRERLR